MTCHTARKKINAPATRFNPRTNEVPHTLHRNNKQRVLKQPTVRDKRRTISLAAAHPQNKGQKKTADRPIARQNEADGTAQSSRALPRSMRLRHAIATSRPVKESPRSHCARGRCLFSLRLSKRMSPLLFSHVHIQNDGCLARSTTARLFGNVQFRSSGSFFEVIRPNLSVCPPPFSPSLYYPSTYSPWYFVSSGMNNFWGGITVTNHGTQRYNDSLPPGV